MTDTFLFVYGRIEERFVSSAYTDVVYTEPLISLPEEKILSWDDLGSDVINELMIWENASAEDLQNLEESAE